MGESFYSLLISLFFLPSLSLSLSLHSSYRRLSLPTPSHPRTHIARFPHSVPSLLTGVVVDVAAHLGDPDPIRSIVAKVLQEFRRTHGETWEETKEAFTREQWDEVDGLLIAPSYYA